MYLQAKETLATYERRMLTRLAYPNCEATHLKNKCFQMRKKYQEISKWINQTGNGVQNDNPESFQSNNTTTNKLM